MLAGPFRRSGRPLNRRAACPPRDPYETNFSCGRVTWRRAALARRRAEAAANTRADARSDIVASARRSPLAPNARSCTSRSANAFLERSFRRLNIVTSSRDIAVSRVETRKASRVSRDAGAQRRCLGGLDTLGRSISRSDRTARLGSPSATGRPRRAFCPSTFLALRPRLTTGVLVSSERVFQFDQV